MLYKYIKYPETKYPYQHHQNTLVMSYYYIRLVIKDNNITNIGIAA